jgi:valyl-tRNA synthetase
MPDSLASIVQALQPAIERLARASSLEISAAGALPSVGAPAGRVLSVVAGQLEGVVTVGEAAGDAAGSDAGERARLDKELAQAEAALRSARARLADAKFLAKAPPNIVDGARAREAELADRVGKLRASLG